MNQVLPYPLLLMFTMLTLTNACSTEKKDFRTKRVINDQSQGIKDRDGTASTKKPEATSDIKKAPPVIVDDSSCKLTEGDYQIRLQPQSEPGDIGVEIHQASSSQTAQITATQLYSESYTVYSGTNDDGWVMLTKGSGYVTVDLNLAPFGVKQFTVANCAL